jgi:hypothetical protein
MTHMASDWQKKGGFTYDGVPALGSTTRRSVTNVLWECYMSVTGVL